MNEKQRSWKVPCGRKRKLAKVKRHKFKKRRKRDRHKTRK